MQRISVIYLLFIAIFTVSCASRVQTTEKLDLSNGGAIQLKLESSSALTKLSEVPMPSANEFIVKISSTTADENGLYPVVFEKKYGEMPLSIVLKEGEYNITATSGNNEPFSTDSPTYTTSKNVLIEIGQTTGVNLTANVHSYLVDIVYTEEFKQAFTEYYIEAHVVDDRYAFAAMGDQVAYLAPGSTTLVLKGMTATGQAYSSVIKEISSAGRERYVLTLAIRPQGHAFDVLVDTQVEQIGVSGNIDDSLYPEMEEITAGALSYTETVAEAAGDANSAIKLCGSVLITDVELTFKDENLAYLGLEKDRVYHFKNADDIAALNAAGMALDAAAVVGKRSATLDMAAFSSRFLTFDNQPSQYAAHIKVIDYTGKTEEKELLFKVANPTISLDEITAGDSWAKWANIPAKVTVEVGGTDYINNSNPNLEYQLSTDQTNWIKVPQSATLTGLTPSTTYYLRAVYRGHIATNTRTFTTEGAPQVENAGMENWQRIYFTQGTNAIGYGSGIACYYPWNSGESEWWSTSNCRTVRYTILKNQTNNTPGVMWTTAAKTGGRAAEIRSVWPEIGDSKRVSGKLLIGKITSTSPGSSLSGMNPEYISEGRPFTSRPTTVSYWYKYAPFNSSEKHVVTVKVYADDEVIGSGQVVDGASVTDYLKREITIDYTVTNKRATALYICFASSENEEPPVSWQNVSFPDCYSSGWKGHKGSVLNIDDIELLYK